MSTYLSDTFAMVFVAVARRNRDAAAVMEDARRSLVTACKEVFLETAMREAPTPRRLPAPDREVAPTGATGERANTDCIVRTWRTCEREGRDEAGARCFCDIKVLKKKHHCVQSNRRLHGKMG
jgi:hypothetical protein